MPHIQRQLSRSGQNQILAESRQFAHCSPMGRERDFLLSRIRLALAGHAVRTEELASHLPHPAALDRLEKAALIALHSWSDDAELRASLHRLDGFGRQRLHDLSVSLAVVCGDT